MNIRALSLSILALLTLTIGNGNESTILAKEKDKAVSIQQLEEIASGDKVTVLVFDEEDRISEEFHSDGLKVKYNWDQDQIISSEDSEGGEEQYSIENGKFIVERYYNDELIEVKSTDLVNNVSNDDDSEVESENSKALATNEDYMVKGIRMNDFISNSTLTSTSDLSETGIQKFLSDRKSILADPVHVYRKDKNGKVYDAKIKVSPAKLIYNAQEDHGISAKVLIALVQKESTLVTPKKGEVSYDSRRFIYALGNGATDKGDMYMLSGFDKQFDGAAKTLKNLYNEGKNKSFPVKLIVNDGKTVSHQKVTYKGEIWVRNAATYAMFRYTPWTIDTALLPKDFGGGNYLYVKCYDMFW